MLSTVVLPAGPTISTPLTEELDKETKPPAEASLPAIVKACPPDPLAERVIAPAATDSFA